MPFNNLWNSDSIDLRIRSSLDELVVQKMIELGFVLNSEFTLLAHNLYYVNSANSSTSLAYRSPYIITCCDTPVIYS